MMLTGTCIYVCRSCVMRMYSCNMSSDTPSGVLVFHTGVSRHSASFHLMGFLRPQTANMQWWILTFFVIE